MERYLQGLLIAALIISGCGIREVETLPLPGGETAIYVRARSKSLLGGPAIEIYDRWLYDPGTGKTKLVRSDSSSVEQKLGEALKMFPVVPLIP